MTPRQALALAKMALNYAAEVDAGVTDWRMAAAVIDGMLSEHQPEVRRACEAYTPPGKRRGRGRVPESP